MIYWPSRLFPALEVRWRLQNRVISGGLPTIGPARLTGTMGAGLWVCQMSGIQLYRRDQIQAARALDMLLDAGLTAIVVGSCETAFAPWAVPTEPVSHADGAPFSDSSFYAGAAPTATVLVQAPLRETRLTISLPSEATLLGGEAFSIIHPTKFERRYQISRVDGDQITFRPELREAVDVGTIVHFHKPGCIMRLVNADEFLSAIRSGRSAELKPTFVEAS